MNVIASTAASTTKPGNSGQDDHQYSLPDLNVLSFNYFDQYTRDHKTFVGEFAAVQSNIPGDPSAGVNWGAAKWVYPQWIGTVSEAIFLLGIERNTDKMIGASYAPLLQKQTTDDFIAGSYRIHGRPVAERSFNQLLLGRGASSIFFSCSAMTDDGS